eukprot:TRINITY_DN1121_c0_g1_i1.p1 TRINITY_DN1121_c0_g1~~TRINITY_DN1121_c0_g1_i1.p1  ORF type:complete len:2561 (+),score=797.58 TRINITY_DN1121_c0_g1_i1:675-7685(+)
MEGAGKRDAFEPEREAHSISRLMWWLRLALVLRGKVSSAPSGDATQAAPRSTIGAPSSGGTPWEDLRNVCEALVGQLTKAAIAAGSGADSEHADGFIDAFTLWGLQCLSCTAPDQLGVDGAAAEQQLLQRLRQFGGAANQRLAPLSVALTVLGAEASSPEGACSVRAEVAADLGPTVATLSRLATLGSGKTAEFVYLRPAACEAVQWALRLVCSPIRDGIACAPLPTPLTDLPVPWSASMLVGLVRGLVHARPPTLKIARVPDQLSDYFISLGGELLACVADIAMFLFPGSLRGSCALLELVCASDVRALPMWWDFLSNIDLISLQMHPHGDHRAPSDAEWVLPSGATMTEVAVLATEQQGVASPPPVSIDSRAPVPGSKRLRDEVDRSALRVLEGLDPAKSECFVSWRLPEGEPPVDGFRWMCRQCVSLLRISNHSPESWLAPHLELATVIIRVFRTFVCGPEHLSETDSVQHFASEGHVCLQRLNDCFDDLRTAAQHQGWTVVSVTLDLIGLMADWPDLRCYAERATLVEACTGFLLRLLPVEHYLPGPPLGALASGTFRPLLEPSAEMHSSMLARLFWSIECAAKRCECTAAITTTLSALLRSLVHFPFLALDLPHVASYVCEVFVGIRTLWLPSNAERAKLAASCLEIIDAILVHGAIPRQLPDGARPDLVSDQMLHALLHDDRMGRALAELLASSCADAADPRVRGRTPAVVSVVSLCLSVLDRVLRAAAAMRADGAHVPAVVRLLYAEPSASAPLIGGERLSCIALLLRMAADAPRSPLAHSAPAVGPRVFALLCEASPPDAGILRHVGGWARPAGALVMNTLLGCGVSADLESSIVRQFGHGEQDSVIRAAAADGMLVADPTVSPPPAAFSDDPSLGQRAAAAWSTAARSSARLLALLQMLRAIVTHQPILFTEAFLSHRVDSNPIGRLLRCFVVGKGAEFPADRRPAIVEAVVALLAAAVESREPCSSRIIARSLPTLLVRFTACRRVHPGMPRLGDTLCGNGPRAPALPLPDFKKLEEALKEANGGDMPCCVFDRTRSWPVVGFERMRHKEDPQGLDTVESTLALVVGAIRTQPRHSARPGLLAAITAALEGVFEAGGYTGTKVSATWYESEGRPVHDPCVWPKSVEVLFVQRSKLAHWLGRRSTAGAGEIAHYTSAAAHVLRAITVVASHGLRPKRSRGGEAGSLSSAAGQFIRSLLGEWEQGDGAEGVLSLFSRSREGDVVVDGLLSMAAGAFTGVVSVSVPHTAERDATPACTPQLRAADARSYGRYSSSPQGLSPMFCSGQLPVRTTPLSLACTPAFGLTGMNFTAFPSSPVASGAFRTSLEERVTLYDLLRRAEQEVRNVLEAVPQLVGAHCDDTAVALAFLRRARTPAHCPACFGGSVLPEAWIDVPAVRSVFPSNSALVDACSDLNDATALVRGWHYLLRSVRACIGVLLRQPPDAGGRCLVPSRGLLEPRDWTVASSGRQHEPAQQCIVRTLLDRCLRHQPVELAGQQHEPFVLRLDQCVRAECAGLLFEAVAEAADRAQSVSDGELDAAERPYRPQSRHVISGAIAKAVMAAHGNITAQSQQNDDADGDVTNRLGSCLPGEADLLVTLCVLAEPDPELRGRMHRGIVGLDVARLFKILRQYLECWDPDAEHDPESAACVDAAFMCLQTFRVPDDAVAHAERLAGLLHRLLAAAHAELASGPTGERSAVLQDRCMQLLDGLLSLAGSKAAVISFGAALIGSLRRLTGFMPPTPTASWVQHPGIHGRRVPRDPTGEPLPATRAPEPEWVPPREGVLRICVALMTAAGRASAADADPAVRAVLDFCDSQSARLTFLLSDEGLRSGCGEERTLLLRLLCSCACHMLRNAAEPLCVRRPLLPWLLPLLQASVHSLSRAVPDGGQQRSAQQPPSVVGLMPARALAPLSPSAGPRDAVQRRDAFWPAASDAAKEPPVLRAARLAHEAQLYESLRLVLTTLQHHIVMYLPLAVPPTCHEEPSRFLQMLLDALDELHVHGGGGAGRRRALEQRVHEAAQEASKHAPEPDLAAVYDRLLGSCGDGSLRGEGSPLVAVLVRRGLIKHYTYMWSPVSGATAYELLRSDPPSQQPLTPASYADVAVLGPDECLVRPAGGIRELAAALCARIDDLAIRENHAPVPASDRTDSLSVYQVTKFAAAAVSAALQMSNVYQQVLMYAVPSEEELTRARNVLSDIGPSYYVDSSGHAGPLQPLGMQKQRSSAMEGAPGEQGAAVAALQLLRLEALSKRTKDPLQDRWLQDVRKRLQDTLRKIDGALADQSRSDRSELSGIRRLIEQTDDEDSNAAGGLLQQLRSCFVPRLGDLAATD